MADSTKTLIPVNWIQGQPVIKPAPKTYPELMDSWKNEKN